MFPLGPEDAIGDAQPIGTQMQVEILHARRYEIAIVGDVYSAEARASCNSGVLEPTSDTPVQVLASGTFLF